MTERWQERLGSLTKAEPDVDRIRATFLEGPRLPDPPAGGPGKRLAVASFASALAIVAIGAVFIALRERPTVIPLIKQPPLVDSGVAYVISDVDVRFPSGERPYGVDEGRYAYVSWVARWPDEITFPGTAECQMELKDADGVVRTRDRSSLSVIGPGRAQFDTLVRVPQGAHPVSGDFVCGNGQVPDGSTEYVFSNFEVRDQELVADVSGSAGDPIGDFACAFHVANPDGTEALLIVDYAGGVGDGKTISKSEKFTLGGVVESRCEPFLRAEQFTRPYWLPWDLDS